MSQETLEQLRAELKSCNKARKALPKDDFSAKADISRKIKEIKKKINKLNEVPGDASVPPVSAADDERPAAHSENYAGDFDIVWENLQGWDAFAEEHGASFYHSSGWREIFGATMGRELYYATARDREGQILGLLPVCVTHSRIFGDYAVSLPYTNYGGVVAPAPNVADRLVRASFDLCKELNLSHVELRDTVQREGYPVRTDKITMELGLSAYSNHDALLASLSSKVRSQVKKAMSQNIDFKVGRVELVADYYRVFAENMRDLGTPVYARSLFAHILETFPNSTLLIVGYVDRRPASCAFLVNHLGRWEIPWASTLRRYNHLAANMALYSKVLATVIEHQAQSFDFGRSSVDAPTYRFKKQWGAAPRQLYWYYSDAERTQALTTESPKFQLAIKAWQKLPLPIANTIGPHLVKNLP